MKPNDCSLAEPSLDTAVLEKHLAHIVEETPVAESYCQRIVDGRLPPALPETSALPGSKALATTARIDIKVYQRIYGTLCCQNFHQARRGAFSPLPSGTYWDGVGPSLRRNSVSS